METLDLVDIYEKKGSVMAVSDAAAAALLGKGALMAAALNLRINARSMEDRERAKEILDRMEAKLVTGEALADEIYRRALEKL